MAPHTPEPARRLALAEFTIPSQSGCLVISPISTVIKTSINSVSLARQSASYVLKCFLQRGRPSPESKVTIVALPKVQQFAIVRPKRLTIAIAVTTDSAFRHLSFARHPLLQQSLQISSSTYSNFVVNNQTSRRQLRSRSSARKRTSPGVF